jgi:hypothetical protein
MLKCSELIKELASHINYHGDTEVELGMSTDNGDWQFELSQNQIGTWDKENKKYFEITLEIEDIKKFKKIIK